MEIFRDSRFGRVSYVYMYVVMVCEEMREVWCWCRVMLCWDGTGCDGLGYPSPPLHFILRSKPVCHPSINSNFNSNSQQIYSFNHRLSFLSFPSHLHSGRQHNFVFSFLFFFCSVLFCSVLFCSVLFCSVLFSSS